ncbi:MAG: prepilin-type N-terminal cleavage/methylation domain-containing protein [Vicinamibacteria bacterium]|jgi:Tfp pilus assembly protein PilE
MALRDLAERVRSDQAGFTLTELLVVLVVSIVVILALFTYQDVVLRQTTRVFAKVDATQRARTTMETIQARLRSACMAENVTPIQSGSTGTSLSFVSKYGSAAQLTPEKHVIALNTGTGMLTDSIYQVTGGGTPNWTFSSTASSTVTLLDHVSQVSGTPLFRYYRYDVARDSGGNPYLDAAGNTYLLLLDGTGTLPTGTTTSTGGNVPPGTIPANSPTTMTTPLSTADARLAASVSITMQVGAAGKLGSNTTIADAPVVVQDAVVLRLTPVPSEGNLPTVPPCA